jgi:hypothetical protein
LKHTISVSLKDSGVLIFTKKAAYFKLVAPACKAPPSNTRREPSWIFLLRPMALADHIMKRLPTAPPALYIPFAFAIALVVVVQ